jgi:hypothetical protein
MKGAKIMNTKCKLDLAERDSKIIELRGEGKSSAVIAKEVGVCQQTVLNVLTRYGLHEPKKLNASSNKPKAKQKTKKCPVCKAVNNPKEAKFCCMCGADIRNKADIIIEKLNKSYSICCDLLPASSNQEVRDTLMEAIKYIEETNK